VTKRPQPVESPRAGSSLQVRRAFATTSTIFGLLAAIGPLTFFLYPWAYIFGTLAVVTGMVAGWRDARPGIILGIACPILSTIEILIARAVG